MAKRSLIEVLGEIDEYVSIECVTSHEKKIHLPVLGTNL